MDMLTVSIPKAMIHPVCLFSGESNLHKVPLTAALQQPFSSLENPVTLYPSVHALNFKVLKTKSSIFLVLWSLLYQVYRSSNRSSK